MDIFGYFEELVIFCEVTDISLWILGDVCVGFQNESGLQACARWSSDPVVLSSLHCSQYTGVIQFKVLTTLPITSS